jgi:Flp pilus assembly protein TadG
MNAPCAHLSRAAKQLWRDQNGAGAVEFSIVGSLFIVLVLGIVQLGWALQVRNEMSRAADQATRFVQLEPDTSDAEFEARVYSTLADYDPDRLEVDVGETTVGTMEFRTLYVEYGLPVSIPGVPLSVITLSQSRRIPVL